MTRPIGVHVHDNVFQANLQGALAALNAWSGGRVLNLCHDSMTADERIESDLAVDDSAAMTSDAARSFVAATGARIEALAQRETWVSPIIQ